MSQISVRMLPIQSQPASISINVYRLDGFCNSWHLRMPRQVTFGSYEQNTLPAGFYEQTLCLNVKGEFIINLDQLYKSEEEWTQFAEKLIIGLCAEWTLLTDIFLENSKVDLHNNFLTLGIPSWYQAQYMKFLWSGEVDFKHRLEPFSWILSPQLEELIPGEYFSKKKGRYVLEHHMLAGYAIEYLRQYIPIIHTFLHTPGPVLITAKQIKYEMDKSYPGLFDHIAELELEDFSSFFKYIRKLKTS